MGRQLSKANGSSPLWIRMVEDCFQSGGIFPLALQVFRMAVTVSMPWSICLRILYLIQSGPGAAPASMDWSTPFTSFCVMGVPITSHGVTRNHSLNGGDASALMPSGVSPFQVSLHFTSHLSGGGVYLTLSIHSFGEELYCLWRLAILVMVLFLPMWSCGPDHPGSLFLRVVWQKVVSWGWW